MESWPTTLFAFGIGLFVGGAFTANFDTKASLTKLSIATCAIGQDETMRKTKGIASYEVTFEDGQYVTVTCMKEESVANQ